MAGNFTLGGFGFGGGGGFSGVHEGTLIARKAGSGVGVDEVQISHDGTTALIECTNGAMTVESATDLSLKALAGDSVNIWSGSSRVLYNSGIGFVPASGGISLGDSTGAYQWGSLHLDGDIYNHAGDQVIEPAAASALVVRANGGTVGVDDIDIEHNGSHGFITNNSGWLYVEGKTGVFLVEGDGTTNALAYESSALYNNGVTTIDLGKNGSTTSFQDLYLKPSASLTPAANGILCIEATSNTQLTFKLKGSDGTVRSNTLTLA